MKKVREPKKLQEQPRKLIGLAVKYPDGCNMTYNYATFKEVQEALEEDSLSFVQSLFTKGNSMEEVRERLRREEIPLCAVYQYTEVGSDTLYSTRFLKECQEEALKYRKLQEGWRNNSAKNRRNSDIAKYKELYKKFNGEDPEVVK